MGLFQPACLLRKRICSTYPDESSSVTVTASVMFPQTNATATRVRTMARDICSSTPVRGTTRPSIPLPVPGSKRSTRRQNPKDHGFFFFSSVHVGYNIMSLMYNMKWCCLCLSVRSLTTERVRQVWSHFNMNVQVVWDTHSDPQVQVSFVSLITSIPLFMTSIPVGTSF